MVIPHSFHIRKNLYLIFLSTIVENDKQIAKTIWRKNFPWSASLAFTTIFHGDHQGALLYFTISRVLKEAPHGTFGKSTNILLFTF